jgi:hypothetical protein
VQGDKFILDRSAMDMDLGHYLLTETKEDMENATAMAASPSKELLVELNLQRSSLLLCQKISVNKKVQSIERMMHD